MPPSHPESAQERATLEAWRGRSAGAVWKVMAFLALCALTATLLVALSPRITGGRPTSLSEPMGIPSCGGSATVASKSPPASGEKHLDDFCGNGPGY